MFAVCLTNIADVLEHVGVFEQWMVTAYHRTNVSWPFSLFVRQFIAEMFDGKSFHRDYGKQSR